MERQEFLHIIWLQFIKPVLYTIVGIILIYNIFWNQPVSYIFTLLLFVLGTIILLLVKYSIGKIMNKMYISLPNNAKKTLNLIQKYSVYPALLFFSFSVVHFWIQKDLELLIISIICVLSLLKEVFFPKHSSR